MQTDSERSKFTSLKELLEAIFNGSISGFYHICEKGKNGIRQYFCLHWRFLCYDRKDMCSVT
jgi:hypothetical protein